MPPLTVAAYGCAIMSTDSYTAGSIPTSSHPALH